jgi:hypothetical protein
MKKRDLQIMYYLHTFMIVVVASVMWGLALMYRPHLDGVAVYRMSSSMPIDSMANKFSIAGDKNRSRNAFLTHVQLLPYCITPTVYNKLQGRKKLLITVRPSWPRRRLRRPVSEALLPG